MWNKWLEAYDATKTPQQREQTLKAKKLDSLQDVDRRQALKRVTVIAQKRLSLEKGVEAALTTNVKLTKSQIEADLNELVYGLATHKGPALEATKAFSGAEQSGRRANFEGTPTAIKAQTLADTLICLCAKDNGETTDGNTCYHGPDLTNTWSGSSQNNANAWVEIAGLCPPHEQKIFKATEMKAVTDDLVASIRILSGGAHLGAYEDTWCDCKNNDGVCVLYTGINRDTAGTIRTVKWIKKLLDLETKLRMHKAGAQKVQALNSQIEKLNHDLESVAQTVEYERRSQQQKKKQALLTSKADRQQKHRKSCP
uniref:Variant surface glycoprotein 1125.2844 n=1 Tax=Trypanosoma brucei TaxID=5691 RepID=A0A1J0R8U9_9TRYP|nr:variant surface glycoprotein 1125.2844 [Trypanosoma brucei]